MQETIARIPASETVLHVTRDELASSGVRHRAGGDHLSRRALRVDADLAVAQAARQPRRSMPSRSPSTRFWCRLTDGRAPIWLPRFARSAAPLPVTRRTVRAEAEQLEHPVLRHRDGSLPGDELGAVSPGPGRGRRIAPAAAARLAEQRDGGVARPRRNDRSGAVPGSREELVARAYGAFCAAVARLDPDGADSLTMRRCRPRCGTRWPRIFRFRSTPGSERKSRRPRACMRRRRSEAAGIRAGCRDEAGRRLGRAAPGDRRFARPHLERLVRLHAG